MHNERVAHGVVSEHTYEWTESWNGVRVTMGLNVTRGRSEVRRIVLESDSELSRRLVRDLPVGLLRTEALAHLRRFQGLLEATRAGPETRRVIDGAEVPRRRPRTYDDDHYREVWALFERVGNVSEVARRLNVSRPTASRWVARGRELDDRLAR